jgi:hypothetical protein
MGIPKTDLSRQGMFTKQRRYPPIGPALSLYTGKMKIKVAEIT